MKYDSTRFHRIDRSECGLTQEWFGCPVKAQAALNGIPSDRRCNLTPVEPKQTSSNIWRICYFASANQQRFIDWGATY